MLIEEKHLVKVGTRTVKHYRDLGYNCNFRDEILVSTSELSKSSEVRVSVICDYCGQLFYPTYASYNANKKKSMVNKDSCIKCRQNKTKDVCVEKYGVSHFSQLDAVKDKRTDTFWNRYGVDNIMKLPSTVDKIKKTCLKLYGEDNYNKTDTAKTRFKKTCLAKYGFDNPSKVEEFKDKKIRTSLEHYGTPFPIQHEDIKNRCIQNRVVTLYQNGCVPTSSQQKEIYKTLKNYGYKVEINYPESKFLLDIALFVDDMKIDVEYDGWYWHQDTQKDVIRNNILINKFGWKVLRIKSSNSLPTANQLFDAISILKSTDLKLFEIVLEDWG